MSRSGYCDDYDDDGHWAMIRWRGAVASSIRGARGQALLKAMLQALDAMPEKRLVTSELECADGVCALGAVGRARGLQMGDIDPEDYSAVAAAFDIAEPLAREIVYENDEQGPWKETPEHRWQRMRDWVVAHIKTETDAGSQ